MLGDAGHIRQAVCTVTVYQSHQSVAGYYSLVRSQARNVYLRLNLILLPIERTESAGSKEERIGKGLRLSARRARSRKGDKRTRSISGVDQHWAVRIFEIRTSRRGIHQVEDCLPMRLTFL